MDILAGVPGGSIRLHVWDWSRSDLSRVIVAKASAPTFLNAVVSPDGTTLLGTTGQAIDLADGRIRTHAGFEVENDRHVWTMRFSPSGRLVAAGIVKTQVRRTRPWPLPTLYYAEHAWAVRVIDLASDRIVTELAIGKSWSGCLLPDNASIIYTTSDGRLVRQELATGSKRRRLAICIGRPMGCT